MATAQHTASTTVHTGAPDNQRLKDLKTQLDQAITANDMNRVMGARNSLDGILADIEKAAPKAEATADTADAKK